MSPEVGAIIADAAWDQARVDGHDMEPLQEDITPGSYLAMCWVCEGYLCFDPSSDERNMPFGKVWQALCPGAPPDREAMRRDILDLEAATAIHYEVPADCGIPRPPWEEEATKGMRRSSR